MLQMNELEVTIWSLWLDEIHWEMGDLAVDTFVLVTAMQVKERLNDENVLKAHLSKVRDDFPNVDLIYGAWKKDEAHALKINLKEINRLYAKYRQVSWLCECSLRLLTWRREARTWTTISRWKNCSAPKPKTPFAEYPLRFIL